MISANVWKIGVVLSGKILIKDRNNNAKCNENGVEKELKKLR